MGAGGFGSVYLGHDTQLDRSVAIKVLHGGADVPHAEAERFLQEARKLARLSHPGIVTVHDVGLEGGQIYVVSDFLDGPDLGQWLLENRPAWSEAARIAAAVADALAHAHARLIVHRDVKPANIIYSPACLEAGCFTSRAAIFGGAWSWPTRGWNLPTGSGTAAL